MPRRTGGFYATLFRSPASGLEFRSGPIGLYAGWYPTILKADGQAKSENTNFIRVGAAAYFRRHGWSPYIAPAVLFSLDDDWTDAFFVDAGVRLPIAQPIALRLGLGVLAAVDGEIRANPTVGLDVRLGLP